MKRDDVLAILRAEQPRLRSEFGVKSPALFGSVARDAATVASDVDLLVEFDRPTGYFGLVRAQLHREPVTPAAQSMVWVAIRPRSRREGSDRPWFLPENPGTPPGRRGFHPKAAKRARVETSKLRAAREALWCVPSDRATNPVRPSLLGEFCEHRGDRRISGPRDPP